MSEKIGLYNKNIAEINREKERKTRGIDKAN